MIRASAIISSKSPLEAYNESMRTRVGVEAAETWVRRAVKASGRARDRKVGLAQYVTPLAYSETGSPVNVRLGHC